MRFKKLIGERISLASITSDDAEQWAEWLNDLEVSIPLGDEAYTPITVESMRDSVNSAIKNGQHVFSIITNDSEAQIGRCLLFAVDHINRNAKLGIFIGDKGQWGKGYGKEALTLLLDYAFNILNLNSVMLGAFSFNTRAINCYRSVGFKEIGRRRQARLIGNKYYDGVLMDILAEEFTGSVVKKYLE